MKTFKNHVGTILILIVLIAVGYLTSSGGLWLSKVYPQESEFIGIGLVAGFIAYLVYKMIYTIISVSNDHEIQHH